MMNNLQEVIKVCLVESLRPIIKLLSNIIKWLNNHERVLLTLFIVCSFTMFMLMCSVILSIFEIIELLV